MGKLNGCISRILIYSTLREEIICGRNFYGRNFCGIYFCDFDPYSQKFLPQKKFKIDQSQKFIPQKFSNDAMFQQYGL